MTHHPLDPRLPDIVDRFETVHWRKVTIESDERTGEIILSYAMPSGDPQVVRYSRLQFIEQASQIAMLIGFHVCP